VKHVLVVDDEWAIAELLTDLLGDEGFHVTTAGNGKQALGKISDRRPDLILLDFMMPIMDGPATLRALAADARTAGIPVVMMSSLPEAAVAERASGYRVFLRKPFRIPEVQEAVRRALEGA
jgi:CheY-like chemotaxis protein